ncbi:peptidase S8/S53 domain-containing protein, partial [Mycena vulgaris]
SPSSCPLRRPSSAPSNRKRASKIQTNAAWSLARIAQKTQLTTMGTDEDGPDEYPSRAGSQDWSFPYDDTWGDGVIVYIIDSGVRSTHAELAGRVENGWVLPRLGGKATDDLCDHGTAVAALVVGKTLGIARKATIVPVRVADATGCSRIATTSDDVTAGVNWAVSDYQTRCNAKAGIINISYQLYQTDASQKALADAIAAKMHVIVTAGNDDQNQCFGGPAAPADQRVKDVGQFIIGNTDWDENRFSIDPGVTGSNYGSCLTLFAPGASMNIASGKDDTTIEHGGYVYSGTSYAAPLVAGAIAAFVTSSGNIDPAAMRALIVKKAVNGGGLKDLRGSPDILLQSPVLGAFPQ